MKVAVTVGSRGISNLYDMVYQTVYGLEGMGANPFIVPAMGSHGGANENGQLKVLEEYGITESSMCVPVDPLMDVVEIGYIVYLYHL